MAQSANISQDWDFEYPKGNSPTVRISSNDEILEAFAQKYRNEGWEKAELHYKPIVKELKSQIAILLNEKELKKQDEKTNKTEQVREYCYNAAHFPKLNASAILDALVDLVDCKREKGKYIINKKTDWYMVWKVLHYFILYTGSEYDFVDIVNDCIMPYIKEERKAVAKLTDNNFKSIKKDDTMKKIAVYYWRKELKRYYEESPTSQHGTLALERGINIMVRLQQSLIARGVESLNYEK